MIYARASDRAEERESTRTVADPSASPEIHVRSRDPDESKENGAEHREERDKERRHVPSDRAASWRDGRVSWSVVSELSQFA